MPLLDRLLKRFRNREDDDAPVAPAAEWRPSLPRYAFSNTTVEIAAVGDIHGRIDLLRQLTPELDRAVADPQRRLIEIYLGDYVDHAGDPRAVLDHLIERRKLTDRDVICLVGNHEKMMLSALDGDESFVKWLDYGGAATLKSYGVSLRLASARPSEAREALRAAVPPSHVAFLQNLRESYAESEFFFVHAGVRPGAPIDQQSAKDLLWIREPFLSSFAHFGATVVHGHTPTATVVMRPNRIGLDTGAYRTGVLTAMFLNSDRIRLVDSARR
ncbi:serine/threonine protein phosphatase 1 [Rhodoblastus acidophilus]|uniref:metallophosphoesterase n=1 Tax=Rhodoblastus acidophilus TaxID=1074 RepID=UPI00222462DC|nr:metallophosphoesterase [Rhodoblastus acidophilus]MCW2318642.1 serine/threonine protein phosphatase 1 [Rhodoblastus acidophilus]